MKNAKIEQAYERATRSMTRLAELGITIAHGQALEALAAEEGHRNWHAYRAALAGGPKMPRAGDEKLLSNLEVFFGLLEKSDAVTLDDGALLDNWETSSLTGEPDNQVAYFSWSGEESDYSDSLTEEGIASGRWLDDGKFICTNFEGETTVVRFFRLERLSPKSLKNLPFAKFADGMVCSTTEELTEYLEGIPANDPYTERSFELGALGRDDLLSVLEAGDFPAHVYDWPASDIRAVILEAEFPSEKVARTRNQAKAATEQIEANLRSGITIYTRRCQVADDELARYDFGDGVTVNGTESTQWNTDVDDLLKVVGIEYQTDDGVVVQDRVSFHVRFTANTAATEDAYGLLMSNGSEIGERAGACLFCGQRCEGQCDEAQANSDSSDLFALSETIKSEYLASGCQASDVDTAVGRLMAECGALFENDRAAWEFIMEEAHDENERDDDA